MCSCVLSLYDHASFATFCAACSFFPPHCYDTAVQFHRSGRAKDARKHHGEAEETREDRESGAKLEYRDQWGREITRKEAFRNLCYQVFYVLLFDDGDLDVAVAVGARHVPLTGDGVKDLDA